MAEEIHEENGEDEPLLPPPPPPINSSVSKLPGASSEVITVEAGNARWLGLLCAETLALLVLQIILGVLSGSLALLADSPHSAVDVVTYALAYWAERTKVQLSQGIDKRNSGSKYWGRYWSAQKLDALIAGICLALLLSASGIVAKEAVDRMRERALDKESDDADFQTKGSALLAFSIVSTLGNVAVLVMFRVWRRPVSPPPPLPFQRPDSERKKDSELQGMAEAGVELCRHRGRCQPPCRARARTLRRLCIMKPDRSASDCNDSCCSEPGAQESPFSSAVHSMGWPTLHELLHPGCAHKDHAGAAGNDEASEGHAHSLNTSSAMLHLISDVLRGLTIFIVALLMKCHVLTNARRADAVCALLVVVLVVAGSGALLTEVCRTLCNCGRPAVEDL